MRTCPHCGVYVEDEVARCPLCYTPLDGGELPEGSAESQPPEAPPEEHPRFWLLEVVTLLAAVGALVVFAADFAVGFRLSWAPLPLVSIAYGWALLASVIALGRKPASLWALMTAATVGYLAVLDLLTGEPSWFVELGLPLAGLAAVLVLLWTVVVRRYGASTLPAVALALVGGGLYTVGVELIVRGYMTATVSRARWSVVVLACAIALALVLVVVHRRLRRRHTSLERIFHL